VVVLECVAWAAWGIMSDRKKKKMWNWIYVWSMATFQLHLTLHRLPKARETHSHTHT